MPFFLSLDSILLSLHEDTQHRFSSLELSSAKPFSQILLSFPISAKNTHIFLPDICQLVAAQAGLEINFFIHSQNFASASKIYSLKWNHCSLRLKSKSGPNILIIS